MKRAVILIREAAQQFEGLRTSVGLLLANAHVQMFVLHHEIQAIDDAYRDNLAFMDEMNGERYSNNSANVENLGFKHVTMADVARKISHADVIIPF